MKNIEQPMIPLEVLAARLGADHDRAFCNAAGSVLAEEFVGRHALLRTNRECALPSHAVGHNQTAVQARWSPGDETVLFGFRKANENWECVAAFAEKLRGRVATRS
jgi:hypothetical protein